MIKGLAIAARVLDAARLWPMRRAPPWISCAAICGATADLLATYKDGRAHLPAYLDDYAFLADALLELLQTRWRSSDLEFARQLAEVLLAQFEDPQAGGFFFTAVDHEQLIHRSKSFSDDSVPSGNSVAVSVLCRLGVHARRTALRGRRGTRARGRVERSSRLSPGAHEPGERAGGFLWRRCRSWWFAARRRARALGHDEYGAVYAPTRMIFAIPSDAAGCRPRLRRNALDGTPSRICAPA